MFRVQGLRSWGPGALAWECTLKAIYSCWFCNVLHLIGGSVSRCQKASSGSWF